METKSLIIDIATKLFQQKGYKGVGLNEIIKSCNISKGSLYHHFPNGKEELLITCIQSLNDRITSDIEEIFNRYPSTKEATTAMISKLVFNFETERTISEYTFSSIISGLASLSDPVRNVCAKLYQTIEDIYFHKLVADGYREDTAYSIVLMMTAATRGWGHALFNPKYK
ncbi:TetR/AcrR family transcriptional regulator [Oceanobacillus rekensis]|uniref:TetR/AcrR family transcriptional regulator n=1 Tax=Oceanobacillus rekensis TaxID=937927 RepID=UPI001FE2E01F|nr:TetR/AcrR family transcriptional regulator [Oceanobacillus rekensis]